MKSIFYQRYLTKDKPDKSFYQVSFNQNNQFWYDTVMNKSHGWRSDQAGSWIKRVTDPAASFLICCSISSAMVRKSGQDASGCCCILSWQSLFSLYFFQTAG
ncbi:hypothetical protein [Photobacterium halotolerans]|uniref:hypothetical protein n=1 Tax=Photobacterium halotolerans TaxID=265726 RepID=UPI0012DC0C27|nr:hypothetical protein [Photobacterium halotolerans]